MYYYNTTAGRDLITIDEILSMYLWDQEKAPTPGELNDNKWIRDLDTFGTPLEIDVTAYMQEGPGRFVSAADIPFLVDFFNHTNITSRDKPYTHEEMWEILRPDVKKVQEKYNIDVYQYTTGIGSHDYITRAFIFGSTKFTVDFSKIEYKVNSDGKKEISGLRIVPTSLLLSDEKYRENFDFFGGNPLVNLLNMNFSEIVDPSRIGRTVPIEFQNENLYSEIDVDQNLFKHLQSQKALLADSDKQKNRISYLNKVFELVKKSTSIVHKDDKGRTVLYNGIGEPTIPLKEKGISYSLIGGKNKDTLVGDRSDDLLKGGDGDDILSGGYGKDELNGGNGYDTYRADDKDTIEDEDGQGRVYLNGKLLTGGERNSDDPENIYKGSDGTNYEWSGGDLKVGGLTISNFEDGQLGIKLDIKNDKEPDISEAENQASPIIIDMNGDGVKTLDRKKHNIYFDLDNNGFAERTGWVDRHDALLVLDRNRNGVIDSGSELFGNYTLLKNGNEARNGFEALMELDTNKDGLLNSQDDIWAELQLWQDLNSDGITDQGELTNVADSQLSSIDLSYRNIQLYENNNLHRQQSLVTWQNQIQSDIVDIWFDVHTTDTQVTPIDIDISESIAELPNISAFGNVYNLHTAMAVNSDLEDKVKTYIASTPEEQESLLNDLIYTWTGADKAPSDARGFMKDGRQLAVLEALVGRPYYQGYRWQSDAGPYAAKILETEYQKFSDYVAGQIAAKTTYNAILDSVRLQFNPATYSDHQVSYNWSKVDGYIASLFEQGKYDEIDELIDIARKMGTYSTKLKRNYFYNKDAVAGQNYILKGTNSHDTLIGTLGNDEFYGGEGNDTFVLNRNWGQDKVKLYYTGLDDMDVLYFNNVRPDELQVRGINDEEMIITRLGSNDTVTVERQFTSSQYSPTIDRILFSDGTKWDIDTICQMAVKGTDGDDVILGVTDNDIIHAGAGDDTVTGNGKIYGEAGDDRLFIKASQSAEGTLLSGGAGDDILDAGEGTLIFTDYPTFTDDGMTEDGEDYIGDEIQTDIPTHILDGGSGNDILYGSFDNEIYHFDVGFGQDEIYERREGQNYSNVADSYDIVRFGEGITPSDIRYVRQGNDLVLQHHNDIDRITVRNYFIGPSKHYKINAVEFADGTRLSAEQFELRTVYDGTDKADSLMGTDGNDFIRGLAGNDNLFGFGGDDRLEGGVGDDYLSGGNGSSTGSGNDILIGGAGRDHYLYFAGDGIDVIKTGGGGDILFFQKIRSSRLSFHRNEDDLVVLVDKDVRQQVRVQNHFQGGEYALGSVQPDGGYMLTGAAITRQLKPLPQMDSETARSLDNMIAAMAAFDTNGVEINPTSLDETKMFNGLLTTNGLS